MKPKIKRLSAFFSYDTFKITELNKHRSVLFGLSILLVIIYHIWCDTQVSELSIFRMGYIGVDVFLFLSALGCSYAYNKYDIMTFYLRRFLRIIPINCVFVIICGVLSTFVWGNAWSLSKWLLSLSAFEFFNPHLSGPNWYIAALLIFYTFFPLLYLIVKKMSRLAIYAAFFISFLFLYLIHDITWYHSCFISRIGIFLLGILCYLLASKQEKYTGVEVIVMAMIAIIVNAYMHLMFLTTALFAPAFIAVCLYFIRLFSQVNILMKLLSILGKYSLEIFLGNNITRTFIFHIDSTHIPFVQLFIVHFLGTLLIGCCLSIINKPLSIFLHNRVLLKT